MIIFATLTTLAATFIFGFSSGKRFITKGLASRASQLVKEGDNEMAKVFLRLLKEKEMK